jgi:cell division protease FtsH
MTRIRVVSDATDAPPKKKIRPLAVADFGLKEAANLAADIKTDARDVAAHRLPWSRVERAALLTGAPGTGKTALAAAIAREAELNLVPTSYADWQSSGQGALGDVTAAIASRFAAAVKAAPSLLFIDEIDSLRQRGSTRDKWDDWNSFVVNTLLIEVDKAASQTGVWLIAATNRPDQLDTALTRPGRFHRHVRLTAPDEAGRAQIFRYYLDQAGWQLSDDQLNQLAILTTGSTGAAIENVVKAADRAARRRQEDLSFDDLLTAIDPSIESEEMRHRHAIHEAGHVVALIASGQADDISVTIAGSESHTTSWTPKSRLATTRSAIIDRLATLLAGRAAEELILGEVSIGAGGRHPDSDLARATQLAIDAIATEGLGRELLWVPDRVELATCHSARMDEAKALLIEGEEKAVGLLTTNRQLLLAISMELKDKRALNTKSIQEIAAGFQIKGAMS